MSKKTILIGLNHAGTTVARTLRRLDDDMEIVAYDKNDNISFLGCGIALWVKGEFEKPDGLFYATPEILNQEKISVNMRHEIIGLDNFKKTVTIKNLETNEVFEDHYDKLVLAMGSWPIIPPIEGINMEGINIVKLFQHAQQIKAAANDSKNKNVVVVGAGYIGIELVDAFVAKGKKVTLIDVLDRVMPRYYDEEFTKDVQKSMEKDGVTIRTQEKVVKFNGTNNKLTSVVTDKGEYPADIVILAVGFKPSTETLEGKIELHANKAIKVDRFLQTSDKNIYAVGDCIQVHDNAKGDDAYIALATTAVRTGVAVATNIVKNNTLEIPGFQGANAISVFGWNLSSVGINEEVAKAMKLDYECILLEDNDRPEFMHEFEKVKIKILWDKKNRRILGAQIGSVANHTEVMYMFSLAILKNVTIDELPLVDIFFLPHFNKPYNFITLAALEAAGLNYFKK